MGGEIKLSLNPPVDNNERVVKKVGNFSPSGYYGKNVYADDMDKKVIDKNFTEVEDGKYVTTTRERELLCSYHSPTQPSFIKEAGQLCS